jgi:hypothetical protein
MISPHNIQQKGSTGEVHSGRPDKDHEEELRKAGGTQKGEAHEGGKDVEPHEGK